MSGSRAPKIPSFLTRRRHSTSIIPGLSPDLRRAAVDSYADALRIVFICQAVMNFLCFLCILPIQENPLPYVPTLNPALMWMIVLSQRKTDGDFILAVRMKSRRHSIASAQIQSAAGTQTLKIDDELHELKKFVVFDSTISYTLADTNTTLDAPQYHHILVGKIKRCN